MSAPRSDGIDGIDDIGGLRSSLARNARRWRLFDAGREAVALPATGVTGSPGVTAALFAVTALYIGLEVAWSLELLGVIASPDSTRDTVDSMVTHGRMLAAFGLVWALLRSFVFRPKSRLDGAANAALFAGLAVVVFVGIGAGFDRVIDRLTPAASMQAFELAAHRMWAQRGDLEPARQARVQQAAHDPISSAAWALWLRDEQVAADAHAEYAQRRDGALDDAISAALRRYPELVAARNARGTELAAFEAQYKTYTETSRRIEGLLFGRAAAIEAFANATCRMLPNGSASRADFARELSKSCVAQWREAGEAYLKSGAGAADPVVFDSHGLEVRFSEVSNLSESELARFIRDRVQGVIDEQLPTVETIRSSARGRDAIAAVVLPPLSLTLSALGLIANLGALAAIALGVRRHQGLVVMGVLVAALIAIPASEPAGMGRAWSAFAAEHPATAYVTSRTVTVERFVLETFAHPRNQPQP